MRSSTRCWLLLATTCGLAAGPAAVPAAFARDAATTEPGSEASDPAPADIVVTARRRSERLQDVPVSIKAFTGEQLDRAGVARVDDIAVLTPGLIVGSFTPTRPQLFIRGIGTRQIDIGSDPSVGVFVDDVYVSRVSGQMTGLADLERVEVLKGPQGTLYGRNTIGGAINIITRAPSRETTAFLDSGIGSYGYFDVRGSASGTLVNDLAYGRLSFFRTYRDGYVRNLETGKRAQGIDQYDIRGKVLLTRDGPFSLTMTVDRLRDRSPGQQGKSAGPDVFIRSPFAPLPALSGDPLADRYNVESVTRQNVDQYVSRAEWRRGIAVTLITGYRESTLFNDGDVDYTILDSARQTSNERSNEFSQELRVASERGGALTFHDRLSWIAGFYHLRDSARRTDLFTFGRDSLPVLIANAVGIPRSAIGTSSTIDRVATSYAAFLEMTWKLSSTIELITGGRMSWEKKAGDYVAQTDTPGVPPLPAPFAIPLGRSWKSFNPRITLDWHAGPDTLLFATYSEGFKSGGFQFAVTDAALASRIFNPEKVEYVEGGIKTSLLRRQLQIDASAFHYRYTNLQTQRTVIGSTGTPTSIVENAANSTIKGAEANLIWRSSRAFTVSAGFTYLDARYDDYDVGGGLDFSGTRLIRAPRFSSNVAADFTPSLTPRLRLVAHADWFHSASLIFEPGEQQISPANLQRAYDQVNLRIGLEWRQWSLSAFVNNLFDVRYRAANDIIPGITSPFGQTGLQSRGYFAAPRMAGAKIGWRL